MFLYGVVNASGDSLNTDSIATTPQAATRRAEYLLDHGCQGIDLGGQGSTDNATVVSWEEEWSRLEAIVDALAALGVPLSIDSWKPEVTRRALEH
ncbi:MAG: dihydropteroate synthase, partial [Ilumatobacteraceae bacterium]